MRVCSITLYNATGITNQLEQILYLPVSEEAAIRDLHPIAILTDGDAFGGVDIVGTRNNKEQEGKARRTGQKVYARFRELLELLRPGYAALTVESSMKCHADLRQTSDALAFHNFYVQTAYLGRQRTQVLLDVFEGAYIEPVADGFYISTYARLNPRRISLMNGSDLSYAASKLIGRAGKPLPDPS